MHTGTISKPLLLTTSFTICPGSSPNSCPCQESGWNALAQESLSARGEWRGKQVRSHLLASLTSCGANLTKACMIGLISGDRCSMQDKSFQQMRLMRTWTRPLSRLYANLSTVKLMVLKCGVYIVIYSKNQGAVFVEFPPDTHNSSHCTLSKPTLFLKMLR